MSKGQYVDKIYNFTNKIKQMINIDYETLLKNEKSIIEYIATNWKDIFTDILRNKFKWKINKTGIDDLFKWDCSNIFNFNSDGYKLSEMHDIEIKKTPLSKLINNFISEIEYCGNRFSLNRLFRCHWKYIDILNVYSDRIIKYNYNNKIIFYKKVYFYPFEDINPPNYIIICKDCFKTLKLKLRNCDHSDYSKFGICEICNFNSYEHKYEYKITNPKKLELILIK